MTIAVLIAVARHGSRDEIRNVREQEDLLVLAITNLDKKTLALLCLEGEGGPRPELHHHVPTGEEEDSSLSYVSVLYSFREHIPDLAA